MENDPGDGIPNPDIFCPFSGHLLNLSCTAKSMSLGLAHSQIGRSRIPSNFLSGAAPKSGTAAIPSGANPRRCAILARNTCV
jgi:hypothetical protein